MLARFDDEVSHIVVFPALCFGIADLVSSCLSLLYLMVQIAPRCFTTNLFSLCFSYLSTSSDGIWAWRCDLFVGQKSSMKQTFGRSWL
jgi:hypothetical protein